MLKRGEPKKVSEIVVEVIQILQKTQKAQEKR